MGHEFHEPEQVAQTLALLRTTPLNPEIVADVERWLRPAAVKRPINSDASHSTPATVEHMVLNMHIADGNARRRKALDKE